MTYRFIDHTADIGIRVASADIRGLFEEAARALVEIMGAKSSGGSRQERISVHGLDQVDILVRWLQELLYLIEVRDLRITQVEIVEMGETDLEALVTGTVSPTPLKAEIKAVTYHNLEIQEVDNNLEATIIFDT